jgi:hypothetical protein
MHILYIIFQILIAYILFMVALVIIDFAVSAIKNEAILMWGAVTGKYKDY